MSHIISVTPYVRMGRVNGTAGFYRDGVQPLPFPFRRLALALCLVKDFVRFRIRRKGELHDADIIGLSGAQESARIGHLFFCLGECDIEIVVNDTVMRADVVVRLDDIGFRRANLGLGACSRLREPLFRLGNGFQKSVCFREP